MLIAFFFFSEKEAMTDIVKQQEHIRRQLELLQSVLLKIIKNYVNYKSFLYFKNQLLGMLIALFKILTIRYELMWISRLRWGARPFLVITKETMDP